MGKCFTIATRRDFFYEACDEEGKRQFHHEKDYVCDMAEGLFPSENFQNVPLETLDPYQQRHDDIMAHDLTSGCQAIAAPKAELIIIQEQINNIVKLQIRESERLLHFRWIPTTDQDIVDQSVYSCLGHIIDYTCTLLGIWTNHVVLRNTHCAQSSHYLF